MTDSRNIAKAILSLHDPGKGDTISNLKLQKLLYYVQGFNLAAYERPLFEQKIYAWQYGPVVREVYNTYKNCGSQGIPLEGIEVDLNKIVKSKGERELFKEVVDIYGQLSAVKLMDLTHTEPPWVTTPINDVIEHNKLKVFFKTRLVRK